MIILQFMTHTGIVDKMEIVSIVSKLWNDYYCTTADLLYYTGSIYRWRAARNKLEERRVVKCLLALTSICFNYFWGTSFAWDGGGKNIDLEAWPQNFPVAQGPFFTKTAFLALFDTLPSDQNNNPFLMMFQIAIITENECRT